MMTKIHKKWRERKIEKRSIARARGFLLRDPLIALRLPIQAKKKYEGNLEISLKRSSDALEETFRKSLLCICASTGIFDKRANIVREN